MTLEVYNLEGCKVQSLEYESCAYDNDSIRKMSKYGYTFVLDGVVIAEGARPSAIDNSNTHEEIDKNLTEQSKENLKLMIECVETGKLYNKQSHAARDLGIDPAAVSDSIRTGRKRSGYTFRKVYV